MPTRWPRWRPPCSAPLPVWVRAAGRGQLARAVFEYAGGLGVLSVLQDNNALLVLLSDDADAGTMLYELGRLTPALASLL